VIYSERRRRVLLSFFSFLFLSRRAVCTDPTDVRFQILTWKHLCGFSRWLRAGSWIFQAPSDVKRGRLMLHTTSDLSHSTSVGYFEEPVYFVARLWIFALSLLNDGSFTIREHFCSPTERKRIWGWERYRQCIHWYSHERVNIEDVPVGFVYNGLLLRLCVNKSALLTEWLSRNRTYLRKQNPTEWTRINNFVEHRDLITLVFPIGGMSKKTSKHH